jgi:hypothetical protein
MSLNSQKYGFGIRDPEKTYSTDGKKMWADFLWEKLNMKFQRAFMKTFN